MKICIRQAAENVEVNENHRTACWMYVKNKLESEQNAAGKEEQADE